MTDQHATLDPSDKVLFMLGGMDNKLDHLNEGVTELKLSHGSMQTQINQNSQDIAVLKSQAPMKAPWWSIVGGIAGICSIIAVIVVLFTK
jgi:hypothetical protein